MPLEIERKFLVKVLPDLTNYKFQMIEQAYLSIDPTLRIRKKDNEFILTIKSRPINNSLTRVEVEKNITEREFNELTSIVKSKIIKKKRYLIPHNDHTIELDIFEGEHKGLILAEIELTSESESIDIPDWFGEEVSSKREYTNAFLAGI